MVSRVSGRVLPSQWRNLIARFTLLDRTYTTTLLVIWSGEVVDRRGREDRESF